MIGGVGVGAGDRMVVMGNEMNARVDNSVRMLTSQCGRSKQMTEEEKRLPTCVSPSCWLCRG